MTPMKSTGVQFEPETMEQLRILARGDRIAVGWLIRAAVRAYLAGRQQDIERFRNQETKAKS
jgi:predicted transcriptional regulator